MNDAIPPGAMSQVELDEDLRATLGAARTPLREISERGGGEDWDAPLDLRVARPRATDLRAVWEASGAPLPPQLAGALGAMRPILLTHCVTPFSTDGHSPGRVWGLGYDFVAHDVDANTVAVAPSNDVMTVAKVGQLISLGIDAGGQFGIASDVIERTFGVRASMRQQVQFEVSLTITLRKVIGAAVGIGGAQWKMYRQNEPLDQPHTLLQLVLVPDSAERMRCTVKTWAKQAGWLGTGWGARFWPYADQSFEITLA